MNITLPVICPSIDEDTFSFNKGLGANLNEEVTELSSYFSLKIDRSERLNKSRD